MSWFSREARVNVLTSISMCPGVASGCICWVGTFRGTGLGSQQQLRQSWRDEFSSVTSGRTPRRACSSPRGGLAARAPQDEPRGLCEAAGAPRLPPPPHGLGLRLGLAAQPARGARPPPPPPVPVPGGPGGASRPAARSLPAPRSGSGSGSGSALLRGLRTWRPGKCRGRGRARAAGRSFPRFWAPRAGRRREAGSRVRAQRSAAPRGTGRRDAGV